MLFIINIKVNRLFSCLLCLSINFYKNNTFTYFPDISVGTGDGWGMLLRLFPNFSLWFLVKRWSCLDYLHCVVWK